MAKSGEGEGEANERMRTMRTLTKEVALEAAEAA
jgi:hypothetical protein